MEFPDFDDNLRQAFQRETELFFESIMREDRSVLDLLTADYTFVNERLARHYGIPNVYGSHFRRVTLTDDARRGCWARAASSTVTSHADRTSPVLRGKWILENMLGTPPPPPPADVPPFPENSESEQPRTMRERMEQHRANPGVRELSPADGSARASRWRTSTPSARGAREKAATPIDAVGQICRRHERRRRLWRCGRRC